LELITFLVDSCLACSLTLKIKAIWSPEMLLDFYRLPGVTPQNTVLFKICFCCLLFPLIQWCLVIGLDCFFPHMSWFIVLLYHTCSTSFDTAQLQLLTRCHKIIDDIQIPQQYTL
jgi:hypothetical protein